MNVSDGRNYPSDLPRHSVSVGAVVVRADGRMLAIKRPDNGAWVQPGGVLELDETPHAAVTREVLEETGVHVEPETLTGVYKNMRRHVVSLVFRCRPTAGEPHPTAEASAVTWLTVDEIRRDIAEPFAVRFLDALNNEGPYVRVHDGVTLLVHEQDLTP